MNKFNQIFDSHYTTAKKGIRYCQILSRLCGFNVRIRTSKANVIYLVCSHEGFLITPQVKRKSESGRCGCEWKIILTQVSKDYWKFRPGSVFQHNHALLTTEQDLIDLRADSPCTFEPINTSETNSSPKLTQVSQESISLPLAFTQPSVFTFPTENLISSDTQKNNPFSPTECSSLSLVKTSISYILNHPM